MVNARTHRRSLCTSGGALQVLAWLAVAFGLAACSMSPPKTLRYRLTLEIEVDGVVHTGSSVVETVWYDQSLVKGLAGGIPWVVHARGEALIVDLGSRGALFALLTGLATKNRGSDAMYFPDDPEQVLLAAFGVKGRASLTPDALEKLSHRRDTVPIPASGLPMLVRFRNIRDPLSVEQVSPDDLASSFGAGVKLKRATIAITEAPITTGVASKLIWLRSLNGGYLTGKHASDVGPAGTFYSGMFERS
jgi:hypothetical protein